MNTEIKVVDAPTEQYKWVDICNRWLSGRMVCDCEIIYIARMNMIDFCDEFRKIVRQTVLGYCLMYGEEWIDEGFPKSFGWKLPCGMALKVEYAGIAGNYWNNAEHYSVAE